MEGILFSGLFLILPQETVYPGMNLSRQLVGGRVSGFLSFSRPKKVRRTSMKSHALWITFLFLIFAPLEAQDSLDVGTGSAFPGGNVSVAVSINNTAPLLGFSYGATHSGSILTPLDIVQGSALSALNSGTGAEYFFFDLAPANGPGVILACITTFGGSLDQIPAGNNQEVSVMSYSVSSGAAPGSSTPITPVTTLGSPPTNIVFTVGGVSVFPASTGGAVNISVPAPTSLVLGNPDTCTCSTPVSWVNGATYDSIQIRVDGALVNTLPGSATSSTVTLNTAATEVCVRGVANGVDSADTCSTDSCPVFTPPPPIENLNCELTSNVPGTGCDYQLTWSGVGPYSAIIVSVDGLVVDTLGGTATSSTGSLSFSPAAANFTVEAIDICGGSVNTLVCSLICEEGPTFLRGDCNADGSNNIADVVAALTFLFGGGGTPLCADACDLNDDGSLDISDPVFLLSNLFSNGNNPPAPYPNCGLDGTDTDPLDCSSFPPCP